MVVLNPSKNWDRTICIDFDGVIAEYDGWKGSEFFGKPLEGAKDFLMILLSSNLKVVIFTIRPKEKIIEWFQYYKLPLPQDITDVKIPAVVYIDDRGLKFNGDFCSLLNELKNYHVYWNAQERIVI